MTYDQLTSLEKYFERSAEQYEPLPKAPLGEDYEKMSACTRAAFLHAAKTVREVRDGTLSVGALDRLYASRNIV